MSTMDDWLIQLKALLPESRAKARRAKEVTQTGGYSDYIAWVKRITHTPKPEIRNTDQLIAFMANALVSAGIEYGASYFVQVQNDKAAIQHQLNLEENLHKSEQDDLDQDD